MYVASGDILQLKLGEGIGTVNLDVVATAVTSGREVLMFTGQTSGVTTRNIISADGAFIDEVTIQNKDTISHTVIPMKYDGTAARDLLQATLTPNQALHFKPGTGWVIPCQAPALSSGMILSSNIASGQIHSLSLSSGAVLSGHIASGQVGGNHFGSGSILSAHLASGVVSATKLGSGAIISAHIASGQVGGSAIGSGAVLSAHLASGVVSLPKLISGTAFMILSDTLVTEELISGYKPINISQSGYARVAMAGVSGRMPVHAICVANIASGTVMSPLSGNAPIIAGGLLPTSGVVPQPAVFGAILFCGMSGTLIQAASLASGILAQRIGKVMRSGWMHVCIDQQVTSGLQATFKGTF